MNLQQEFCNYFIQTLVASGVKDFVISPGSRSTPLVIAISSLRNCNVRVILDERSAGFVALGISKASKVPTVLVCTSGTAATEFYPALTEASYSRVPLIAVTANRPYELKKTGAPQTIDQDYLYGSCVNEFFSLSCDLDPKSLNQIIARIYFASMFHCGGPGPVHVDIKLKEPLVTSDVKQRSAQKQFKVINKYPSFSKSEEVFSDPELISKIQSSKRPLVFLGGELNVEKSLIESLAACNIAVLTEYRSLLRLKDLEVVSLNDFLLGSITQKPDFIIRAGGYPTLKSVAKYLASAKSAFQAGLVKYGKIVDPDFCIDHFIDCEESSFFRYLNENLSVNRKLTWTKLWLEQSELVQKAIQESLEEFKPLTSGFIARRLTELRGISLFVSSSMPIREVENFAPKSCQPYFVFANRGVNGIDGNVSTAIGVSSVMSKRQGISCVALLGDLAFLHDLSGNVTLRDQEIPKCLYIVLQNSGGEIFNYLDQKKYLSSEIFNRYFFTPYKTDIKTLAQNFFDTVVEVRTPKEFSASLKELISLDKAAVMVARVNPQDNQNLRRLIEAKIKIKRSKNDTADK